MLKGIAQEFRDMNWHRKHMARLKKRKTQRIGHMLSTGLRQMKRAEEEFKKAQGREAQVRLGWLTRLYYWFAGLIKRFTRRLTFHAAQLKT